MKSCHGCSMEKSLSEFYKCLSNPDGLHNSCKKCISDASARYRAKNKEKLANRKKEWYLENREHAISYASRYYDINKASIIPKIVQYRQKRLKTDPVFKLQKNIRQRLAKMVKQQSSRVAITFLGCTIEELKNHLESRFYTDPILGNMTWDSYGQWEIDHIKPLASFDLSDPNQLKTACHYSNLQPLWKQDHVTKTNNDVRQSKGTI